MITPLPLPVRPSCRLTWIEYRPFFMMWPVTTSVTAEPVACYAKPGRAASTRQVDDGHRAGRGSNAGRWKVGTRNALILLHWPVGAGAGQVSSWIDSGGKAPPLCNDDDQENNDLENSQLRRARRLKAPLTIGFAAMMLALASHLGHARDDGRYAGSPLKPWFDSLKSGKGPCCSDADGSAVSDVDWESKDGHYRVRLDGEWLDVPEDAVITEPNRIGRTMVLPPRGYLGVSIRCFMPGSMT